jgi:hypothetical protein
MKTKKLVLGVCALVVVTGDFWGEAVTAVEISGLPRQILIQAVPDSISRASAELTLLVKQQELANEYAAFRKMGDEEVRRVSEAFLKERRVDLLYKIIDSNTRDIQAIDKKYTSRPVRG